MENSSEQLLNIERQKILKEIIKDLSRNNITDKEILKLCDNIVFDKKSFKRGKVLFLERAMPLRGAYTRWTMLQRPVVVLDTHFFEDTEFLTLVIIHELYHVKDGYWKMLRLIFPKWRQKIEDEINRKSLQLYKFYKRRR